MPIDITRLTQAERFHPAGHHGVGPVRLVGGEHYDGAVTVVLSTYVPGGRAEMSPVDTETVYVVLTGSLTLTDADGGTHVLDALDSARLTAGTLRGVDNHTNLAASMLVIRPHQARSPRDTPEARS